MDKPKVVFTDSGLGGLSVMADFLKLAKKHKIAVDCVYFNAQYSRDLGYKKMDDKQQAVVFNNALEAIRKRYRPDIIAIACNTLSVVYKKTKFYKRNEIVVFDIIETGKTLLHQFKNETIVELAMPTTINAKVYQVDAIKRIAVSTDVMLPDAIENKEQEKIDAFLMQIFTKVKEEIVLKSYKVQDVVLFLGCTHFPFIQDQFLKMAFSKDVKISKVLNPNKAFSQLLFQKVINIKCSNTDKKLSNGIKIVSRTLLKKKEVTNVARLVEDISSETAQALRNYIHNPDLF